MEGLIILLCIWAAQGAICYKIAEGKEKSKWNAFAAGCLFGVFAILYYLVCKKSGVLCSYCRELISKEASICPHCQKEVSGQLSPLK